MAILFCRYFETFDVVSDIDAPDRLGLLDTIAQCSSKEEQGTYLHVVFSLSSFSNLHTPPHLIEGLSSNPFLSPPHFSSPCRGVEEHV